jgi:hypothetical protein
MKPFECFECGGTVRESTAKGRTWYYLHCDVVLPEKLLIPTCDKCDEVYTNTEYEEKIRPIVEDIFHKWQSNYISNLVDKIKSTSEFSTRDISKACGVHFGFFKLVRETRRVICNRQLQRLLEVFAAEPNLMRAFLNESQIRKISENDTIT